MQIITYSNVANNDKLYFLLYDACNIRWTLSENKIMKQNEYEFDYCEVQCDFSP